MPRTKKSQVARPSEIYAGAKQRRRPVRCTFSKLIRLSETQRAALHELQMAWGINGSEVIKRLLMSAHSTQVSRAKVG